MIRSEFRKVLALGTVTGLALPLLAAPAAANPPKDWPAPLPSAPVSDVRSDLRADLPPEQKTQPPARALVRESRTMSGRIYEVRPGDTLWAIAERHLGDATRWPELFQANRSRIADPHRIYPRQKIQLGGVQQASRASRDVSSRQAGTYTVKPGDTLGGIAQRQLGKASQWPVLYALNRETLANPDRIYPGQRLKLSAQRRTTTVVAPRAKVAKASSSLTRKRDDGRLLKGHRRVNGSYYAKGADGHLVWADTQERVHPSDSTLKTALAPKIREAFKVPEPQPVAPKPPARKPVAAAPAVETRPTVSAPAEKPEAVMPAPKIMYELPPAQKTAFKPPTPQDRFSAGALSLVVPGAGQLYNGDPVRAGLFMGAGAATLGTAVYGIASDRQDLGVAASAGLVALSLWSAADAYFTTPPKASQD